MLSGRIVSCRVCPPVAVSVASVVALVAFLVPSCGGGGPVVVHPAHDGPRRRRPRPRPRRRGRRQLQPRELPARQGRRRRHLRAARARGCWTGRGRPGPAGPAEAPDLRPDRRVRARHQAYRSRTRRPTWTVSSPTCARRACARSATPTTAPRRRSGSRATNDFSEDYDMLLSSGHMRRGDGAYRQTCTPATFPVDRDGGRTADRQRLRPALPAARHPLQLQAAPQGHRVLHARLDADRRTRRRSTARRSATPTAARSARCARKAPRPRGLRELARGQGEGHRPRRAHLAQGRRQLLHRARRAAARTTRTPSTRCGPTSPAPTR